MKNSSKLISFLSTLIIFFTLYNNAYSSKLGLGFNNQRIAMRINWNDSISSEVSLGYWDKNTVPSFFVHGERDDGISIITYAITPINFVLYSNSFGSINTSITFIQDLITEYKYDNTKTIQYARGIDTLINIAEINLKMFDISNLMFIGRFSINICPSFNEAGGLTNTTVSFTGIGYSTIGLLYYFGE